MELKSSGTPFFTAFDLAFPGSKSTVAGSIALFVETTGGGGAFDTRGSTGVGPC